MLVLDLNFHRASVLPFRIGTSPATTTRSNRGFELSPRLRPSKIVMRNPPRRLLRAPSTRRHAAFQIFFPRPFSHSCE